MLYLGSVFTLCSQKWQILWYNLKFYSLFLLGGRVSRILTNFHYYVFHYLCREGGGPKGNSAKFTNSSVSFFASFPKCDNIGYLNEWVFNSGGVGDLVGVVDNCDVGLWSYVWYCLWCCMCCWTFWQSGMTHFMLFSDFDLWRTDEQTNRHLYFYSCLRDCTGIWTRSIIHLTKKHHPFDQKASSMWWTKNID